jgi:hypothetical protein
MALGRDKRVTPVRATTVAVRLAWWSQPNADSPKNWPRPKDRTSRLCSPCTREPSVNQACRVCRGVACVVSCRHVRVVVCRVSCVVCRVSCVVCRVSCVVCRVSCVVCRVSCVVSCLFLVDVENASDDEIEARRDFAFSAVVVEKNVSSRPKRTKERTKCETGEGRKGALT